jgi:hypothetical protein
MRFSQREELELPIRAVCCPFCSDWIDVGEWSMLEAMWMHEYECDGIEMMRMHEDEYEYGPECEPEDIALAA